MAFARRTLVTSTSSSNGHGRTQASSSSNAGHGPSSSDNPNDSTNSHSGSIMRRVSTMFTPRKKPPQDTFGKPLAGMGIGYEVPQPRKMGWKMEKRSKARRSSVTFRGSSDSEVEDLDEIRQPNDLGPPAPSIYSSVAEEDEEDTNLATPKKPTQQKIQRRFSIQSIQSLLSPSDSSFLMASKVYTRRSINPSLHSKNSSFHSRTYSHSLHSLSQSLLEEEAELVQDNPVFIATKATKVSAVWAGPSRTTSAPNLVTVLPHSPPTFTLNVRRKPPPRLGLRELPQRVLTRVFRLLPRRLLLGLASLSKNFCSAARIVIYETVDLRNISASRQDKLNTFLARRTDLTELTRVLICSATSSLHLPTFPSALVLSHMNHLTTITLPYFSIDFMQHHTAFGLRSVTFLNTDLTPVEKVELFTWLDGQVNITTLSFPQLFDSHAETDQPMLSSMYNSTHFPLPPSTANSLLAFPPSSPPSSPSLAPPSSFAVPLPPSPLSSSSVNFVPEVNLTLATLSKSSTLLPHLESVCAPPSLLQLLAPYRAGTLKEVGMNINDTLVGGLRPAELIGVLKLSDEAISKINQGGENKGDQKFLPGPEILHLNFGKGVDRRTVEKVLGAAGAVLGGFPIVSLPRDQEEKHIHSVDSHGGPPTEEDPPGLHHLEIAVPFNGPRTEEISNSLHACNAAINSF
ncbi:hypothetical protein BDP27DRAFT_196923 [Rhodocollybia butyracea]|uniref:F-box domain-containing protein n=1 Tax=Rhodocollybia butyracea TaxID=206335 RepID=A0A9P5PXY4_9AGAR|nr:hypothetical protein BDP27DRAFT_196923 [Rhodocollybia butyracea]